jgi:hypothetical protein
MNRIKTDNNDRVIVIDTSSKITFEITLDTDSEPLNINVDKKSIKSLNGESEISGNKAKITITTGSLKKKTLSSISDMPIAVVNDIQNAISFVKDVYTTPFFSFRKWKSLSAGWVMGFASFFLVSIIFFMPGNQQEVATQQPLAVEKAEEWNP